MASAATPLRLALGAHLGQVLTPEVAAAIEAGAAVPAGNSPETIALLNKWRHMIEPVIQSSPTPISWDLAEKTPVHVYEASKSVLVVRMAAPQALIWVAAGEMTEVLDLFGQATHDARCAGCSAVAYLGREGWLRVSGFRKRAVYGVKEI